MTGFTESVTFPHLFGFFFGGGLAFTVMAFCILVVWQARDFQRWIKDDVSTKRRLMLTVKMTHVHVYRQTDWRVVGKMLGYVFVGGGFVLTLVFLVGLGLVEVVN